MKLSLERVYDAPADVDGVRILVERLWPRGLSKERARIDVWLKDVAPSAELRRWFDHSPDKWIEFKRLYFEELASRQDAIDTIRERLHDGPVVFVFASRETRFNNAVALKEYIEAEKEAPVLRPAL